jgi:hypothetical protein
MAAKKEPEFALNCSVKLCPVVISPMSAHVNPTIRGFHTSLLGLPRALLFTVSNPEPIL